MKDGNSGTSFVHLDQIISLFMLASLRGHSDLIIISCSKFYSIIVSFYEIDSKNRYILSIHTDENSCVEIKNDERKI